MMTDLFDAEPHQCVFSPCRTYRYSLRKVWEANRPCLAWVGLNPSTADEQKLDPTLKRIEAFSRAWGFGAFLMLNLFAFRSPHPEKMLAAADPVGPGNDEALKLASLSCGKVVACWGNTAGHPLTSARAGAVAQLLLGEFSEVWRIGSTMDGSPKHPLARGKHRVPNDQMPLDFLTLQTPK